MKTVKNLLQVVPSNVKEAVAANDSDVKDRVEASLKADVKMKDVKVASVNNGVVLLSGKTDSLTESLRAIENAYSVNGVHRVASELEESTATSRAGASRERGARALAYTEQQTGHECESPGPHPDRTRHRDPHLPPLQLADHLRPHRWTLSTGYFPAHIDLPASSYWAKGLVASLLFFVSPVHELGHAVVALRHGVRTRSITLFIFGGVALLEKDPRTGGPSSGWRRPAPW